MSECFAMLKSILLPDAQTAAAKRLTRFNWNKILSIIWWSNFEKITSRFWERWLPIYPCYLGLVGDIWSYKYADEFRYLYGEVFLKNNEPFREKVDYNTSMLSGSCYWYKIVQVCLLISMFPATIDAQSAAAKWMNRFIWKVIFSCIRWRNIRHK